MKLCFLRHGEADWPNWDKPDNERPLTERGHKEMKRVAKFLERLKLVPDVILTSPLPRASQTAEIVGKRLGIELKPSPRSRTVSISSAYAACLPNMTPNGHDCRPQAEFPKSSGR